MIRYVEKKYGKDHVGQIITYTRLGARNATRAAGRALGFPYDEVDIIAKMIPDELGITLKESLEISDEMRTEYENNSRAKLLLNTALSFEGLPSDTSTHAAGVIISPHKLIGNLPLWVNRSGNKTSVVSQYDMVKLEELGYLKMDFLGLSALTTIGRTIEYVKENHGVQINFQELLEGKGEIPEVYKMISDGETEGIFQLEGHGMTQTARQMRPSSFKELTALISLYRPGPMAYIPDYIRNKEDPNRIKVPFKELESILGETYGVLVYQEQVMRMVQDISGYSMAMADSMRKAIGKKKEQLIEEHRKIFIEGINKDGERVAPGGIKKYSRKELEEYYDETIIPFGKYAFNKSHGASYARIAEMQAYLKYKYPVEFMAASIESLFDKSMDKKRMAAMKSKYFDYCDSIGIEIEPPNINTGRAEFRPTKKGNIVYGMGGIKGAGSSIGKIQRDRQKNGKYKDIADFLNRAFHISGVTRTTIEGLAKVGAFDCLGVKRSEVLAVHDSFAKINKRRKNRKNPDSLKKLTVEDVPKLQEFDKSTILRIEKKYSGTYFSGHPLKAFKKDIKKVNTMPLSYAEVMDYEDSADKDKEKMRLMRLNGQRYDGIVLITSVSEVLTKRDRRQMAFIDIDDMSGSIRAVIFPDKYSENKSIMKSGTVIRIRGKLNLRDGEISVLPDYIDVCKKKEILEPIYLKPKRDDLERLKEEIQKTPGRHPVIIVKKGAEISLPEAYWVSTNGGLSLVKKFNGEIGGSKKW